MQEITFTPEQVQQIINTILEMPAKHCYDTLKMIDQVVASQVKKEEPETAK